MFSILRGQRFIWRKWFPRRKKSSLSVCVEGNIASGKTTCIEYCKNLTGVDVQEEPVTEWRNIQGHNALATMYSNPSRWAFTFQMYVLITLARRQLQPWTDCIRVSERSLYSARYCFIENQYRSKYLTDMEYILLDKCFDRLKGDISGSGNNIDIFVYLRTHPEVVHARIKQRQRLEEHSIPLTFLQDLHELHEEWLIRGRKFKTNAEILVLDANKDIPSMLQDYERLLVPLLQLPIADRR